MRVYVMMDIEGVAGVVHSEEGVPGNPEYERARRLMTNEASAIAHGICYVDPDAQVVVVDSHGSYRNMIPELLDDRARLMRGKPRVNGMMDGIDGSYDFAIFGGVHGRGGQGNSVLSHTFTGHLLDIRINGASCGELELNSMIAGFYGVPVAMVSGDQHVTENARTLLGDDVLVVTTKESRGASAGESMSPNQACVLLRLAAKEAAEKWRSATVVTPPAPVSIEVEFDRPVYADLALLIDGAERISGREVRFQRTDFQEAFRLLRLLTVLCSTPV